MARRAVAVRTFAGILLLSAALFSFASSTIAETLVEPQTGLTLDAPSGYTLTLEDDVYVLSNGKLRASLVLGNTVVPAAAVAEDLIDQLGVESKSFEESGDTVTVKGKRSGKAFELHVRTVSETSVEVITFDEVGGNSGDKKNKKKKKKKSKKKSKKKKSKKKKKGNTRKKTKRATLPVTAALTVQEVLQLDQILRSRQGGRAIALPVGIPVKQLVGSDTTSALVPDLPGWQFFANDGIISGGHNTLGAVNLGIPVAVGLPGSGFNSSGVVNAFVPPAQAIAQVWPQFVFVTSRDRVAPQVLGVQQVPGTDGWLGGSYVSGMFVVRFALNGQTFQALMVAGVAPTGTNFSWLFYHSYIMVNENAPPGIGVALLNVWRTWNNEAANQARLANIVQTIRTTVIPGNPIDPDVFDAIARKWNELIRQ